MDFATHLEKLHSFLLPYHALMDTEVLALSLDSFEKLYPCAFLDALEQISLSDLRRLEGREIPSSLQNSELKSFFTKCFEYADDIPSSPKTYSYTFVTKEWDGINPKKQHELSCLFSFLTSKALPAQMIEIGGGLGHLSQVFSKKLNLPCVSLDQDLVLQNKGRSKKNSLVTYLCANLPLSSYNHIPALTDHLLIGLHTCGDLVKSQIEMALNMKSLSFLNLGCCYHKTHDTLSALLPSDWIKNNNQITLSSDAKTLACRSHTLPKEADFHFKIRLKKFRYTFQLFLREHFSLHEITKLGPSTPMLYAGEFADYAQEQLRRINKNLPWITSEILQSFFDDTQRQRQVYRMILAGIMRQALGRPLELFIILSRAQYLAEQGYECQVTTCFDETISPRNLCIYGIRPSA
ncbi:MAG: methyltransferase [Bacteriovoracaceae bacterium]|nr:methyltransferase [Bacteriovoracaceae bacterium]